MRFVNAWAYNFSTRVTEKYQQSEKFKKTLYKYLRWILNILLKSAAVLIIAYFIDILWPTIFCAVVYGFVRIISGNVSGTYRKKSIILTIMFFTAMGVIADTLNFILNELLMSGLFVYLVIFFVISLLLSILYVPIKTSFNKIVWPEGRVVYKIVTVVFVILAAYISVLGLYVENPDSLKTIMVSIQDQFHIVTSSFDLDAMLGKQILNIVPAIVKVMKEFSFQGTCQSVVIYTWIAIIAALIMSNPFVYLIVYRINRVFNYR